MIEKRYINFLLDRIDAKLASEEIEEVKLHVAELRGVFAETMGEGSMAPRPAVTRTRKRPAASSLNVNLTD